MAELTERVNKQKSDGDGLGWWTDYVCRLVKTYPTFTKRFVVKRLAMVEGWSWYAFARLDDPMAQFVGLKPVNGYLKQESRKLIEQAHKFWNEQK